MKRKTQGLLFWVSNIFLNLKKEWVIMPDLFYNFKKDASTGCYQ